MDSAALCKRKPYCHQVWKIPLIPFFITAAATAVCLLIPVSSISQNITVSVKGAALEKVFRAIEKQSPYRFVYSNEELENTFPVTADLKNASLQQVLTECFKNQPVTYTITDHIIMIKTLQPDRNAVNVSSERINVTGKVVNEQGEALDGVSVIIKEKGQGTISNGQGIFTLDKVDKNAVIIFSSVGYSNQEITLRGRTSVTVTLAVSINTLDQAVVIGYGQTTRRLNTGSVSRVTSEEINRQPVSNPLAALEGRVPGLFITQGSGLPGSNFTVRIRGRNSIQNGNSPLFIVDGVPFLTDAEQLTQRSSINANSPFNSINAEDIESIEVLKDADATAIYGSRGANGVILITTKKGVAGKTRVEFNTYSGWGKVTRTMNYMNTSQYLQMRREAFQNDGKTPTISSAPDLLAWDTTRYIDWKKLLIGNTAHTINSRL